jgi:hypothetical protein
MPWCPSCEDDVQPDHNEGVDARESQAEPDVGRDALGQSRNLPFEVIVLIHPDQDTESRFVSLFAYSSVTNGFRPGNLNRIEKPLIPSHQSYLATRTT